MLLMVWHGYYGLADYTIPVPEQLCGAIAVEEMRKDIDRLATGNIHVECRNPEWGDYWATRDYLVRRNSLVPYDYLGWVDCTLGACSEGASGI